MWIRSVLRKIIQYKAQHQHVLEEAATTLKLTLPQDIVIKNVLPFLELPLFTFEVGDHEDEEDDSEEEEEEGDDESSYWIAFSLGTGNSYIYWIAFSLGEDEYLGRIMSIFEWYNGISISVSGILS